MNSLYGIRTKKCNTCSPSGVILPKHLKAMGSTDKQGSNKLGSYACLAPLDISWGVVGELGSSTRGVGE